MNTLLIQTPRTKSGLNASRTITALFFRDNRTSVGPVCREAGDLHEDNMVRYGEALDSWYSICMSGSVRETT